MTRVFISQDLRPEWTESNALSMAFALQGEVFRKMPGRCTMQVPIKGRTCFVKLHYGVGLAEFLKNLLQFKWPVIGAENEYRACLKLEQIGIWAPRVLAYASGSGVLWQRRSFVLTDALQDFVTLEDVGLSWQRNYPSPSAKRAWLVSVAEFARRFHAQGFVHRDFYLCHLLAPAAVANHSPSGGADLGVLDLHRALLFSPGSVPDKWLERDMAALLFSALELGYTQRDWLRFLSIYAGRPWRAELKARGRFWRRVWVRAHYLYDRGKRKGLVQGTYRPSPFGGQR